MTLKSDGPSVMGQNIGGGAWTETKPVTLQYGDPIETRDTASRLQWCTVICYDHFSVIQCNEGKY